MSHQSALIENDIESYLQQHEQKDILRFITCGSVDDGKSTLIGRMLHDSKMIYEDQLAAIEKESKTVGTTGTKVDLALLVDGLQSEREQGITIDVAYRYFSTEKRKFIIADTPGHEQYTRNMATGASSAHLAVLLIDARYGVQVQTRRHSYICSLLGIKHFVVAVNKMDLVDYCEEVFESIKSEYSLFARNLEIPDIQFVPMSALDGDNVVSQSQAMPWYKGDTLMSILEAVELTKDVNTEDLRLPVQYVNRPHLDFRGYCGTLASGLVTKGQRIKVLPSGKTSTVETVLASDQDVDAAFPGQAITITLTDEIDISRGDVIVGAQEQVSVGNEFEAHIVWMHEEELAPGKLYDFKLGTTYANGLVSDIDWQVDVNTLEQSKTDKLTLNGIGQCQIKLTQDVVYDLYKKNPSTGSFIIIDRLTNVTVGSGMITRVINSAANDEHHQSDSVGSDVTRSMRTAIKPHSGKCFWILSSDKGFNQGRELELSLNQRGYHTYLLNDETIASLCIDLSNSTEDASERTRRIAEVARLMIDAGLIVITDVSLADVTEARKVFEESELFELTTDQLHPATLKEIIAVSRN